MGGTAERAACYAFVMIMRRSIIESICCKCGYDMEQSTMEEELCVDSKGHRIHFCNEAATS